MQAKLPPEAKVPQSFKTLRPTSILSTSHGHVSRVRLQKSEACDLGIDGSEVPGQAMMGFRKGQQSAESVHVLRSLRKKAAEWCSPLLFAQVDFAHAYDSVLHGAVVRTMLRRGVPPPLLGGYLRDMRSMEPVFEHNRWQTRGIRPRVGLRQGSSLSPLVSRWVMDNTVAEARREWGAARCMDDEMLQMLAWAGDAWSVASSPGLEFRLGKCMQAEVCRTGQTTHAHAGELSHV